MANLSQRNIKLFLSILLVACILFLFDINSTSRHLEGKDLHQYDKTCPLAMEGYIGVGPDVHGSLAYSIKSGAQSVVEEALENNGISDGKIVIVGDSHMRQVFSSFACFAHTAGYWKHDNAYTSAIFPGWDVYYDARLKMKKGFGEMFYAPTAGKVQTYGWQEGGMQPINGNEDWLKSCRDRKPFYLETYGYDAPNVIETYSEDNEIFEKVRLGKDDTVFFNSGQHTGKREGNVEHLTELLDCMDTARADGDDTDWPQISYVISNQLHFGDRKNGGAYGKHTDESKFCLESVDSLKNPFLNEDKDVFGEKLTTVGFDLDFGKMGNMHIGKGSKTDETVGFTDCAHWTMPGVPDVLAKEVAASILTTSTNRSLTGESRLYHKR